MQTIARILFVFVLASAMVSASFAAEDQKAEKSPEKEYVAVVNGEKITKKSLDQKLAYVQSRYASQGRRLQPQQLADVQKDIVERMVEKELLYQESKDLGITIEDEKVKGRLQQFQDKFPNKEKYQQQLDQLGYTEEMIRREIRENMAIQQLIEQEIASGIEVTDEDLQSYYDDNADQFTTPAKVKARHILVKTDKQADAADTEAAREKIEAIQKRVAEGEEFAEVAKEESECPSSDKGGDLGFFSKGRMVPPFEDAAFSMEPGEVSDIVETRFGYHLIKVEDKKEASQKSYEEVKENLRKQLENEKVKEAIGEYVAKLREDAEIEMNLPQAAESSGEGKETPEKG
jgi:peptidyl-prolyl cis-trans isomerase C